jgi:hypothetical protein
MDVVTGFILGLIIAVGVYLGFIMGFSAYEKFHKVGKYDKKEK